MFSTDLEWPNSIALLQSSRARRQLGGTPSPLPYITPSCRRSRELCERAVELGHYASVENLQDLTYVLTRVTSSGKPPHTTPTPFA